MDIRIGTSGCRYRHWLGRYYPEGMKPSEVLARFMRDLDTALCTGRPLRPSLSLATSSDDPSPVL